MNDHVEIGHLTKYDAFRVNRDQVMDLEIWFKIHTNVFNFETAPPKSSLPRSRGALRDETKNGCEGDYPKSYKLLKYFMISVILFKMSKHSDFHLIFFEIEGV